MNMNTKITIALVLVIVAGLLVFVAMRAPEESTQESTGEAENLEEQMGEMSDDLDRGEAPTTGTGSFAYLMESGRNLKCDIVYEPQSGTSVVATVYVDGEHMRVDSEMMMAGETYLSHMIMDHDMVYTWNESGASNMAVKFKVDEADTETEMADSTRQVDLNQQVDYDCSLWTVDDSVFNPPADIEFMDMEDMMRGAGFDANIQVQ